MLVKLDRYQFTQAPQPLDPNYLQPLRDIPVVAPDEVPPNRTWRSYYYNAHDRIIGALHIPEAVPQPARAVAAQCLVMGAAHVFSTNGLPSAFHYSMANAFIDGAGGQAAVTAASCAVCCMLTVVAAVGALQQGQPVASRVFSRAMVNLIGSAAVQLSVLVGLFFASSVGHRLRTGDWYLSANLEEISVPLRNQVAYAPRDFIGTDVGDIFRIQAFSGMARVSVNFVDLSPILRAGIAFMAGLYQRVNGEE